MFEKKMKSRKVRTFNVAVVWLLSIVLMAALVVGQQSPDAPDTAVATENSASEPEAKVVEESTAGQTLQTLVFEENTAIVKAEI